MKALAKGTNEEVILKLLKNLLNTTQGNYHETFLDDGAIRDIADVVTTDKPLFAEGEDQQIIGSTKSKKKVAEKRSD
eukprot:CAMPEP_0170546866 /NCGR_PEP_ID=MMETSP0211-20121228/5224_1 /TAXON_ID=311385 /ORGANISM="Pseudokeronopsis sp., Strain OXSARD2" /LENGTH=76 /DNA_ID=CAMNT_0010851555 /DNA_START=256 /DNA_END=486 /DNA_ORIENTATION=-